MFHEHYCKREFVRHHQRITSLRITLEVGSLHFISTFLPTGNPLDVEGIWTLIPNMMLRALIPTFSLTIHMYLNANVIVVMKSRETSPFQSKRINVRVCREILDFPIFCKARCTHTHVCVYSHAYSGGGENLLGSWWMSLKLKYLGIFGLKDHMQENMPPWSSLSDLRDWPTLWSAVLLQIKVKSRVTFIKISPIHS